MTANPRMQAIIDLKDNLSGKMRKVSASLTKTTSSLKKTEVQAKKTNKGFSKLVGTMQGLGAMRLAAALGALFFVRKLLQFTKESTAAADIQERAEARLASAMRNVAGNTEESFKELKRYASELQQVTAVGDETTLSTMAMLSTFQLNSDQIKQLTPRVLDMTAALEKSTGTQQEAETVAIAMGKAMTIGVGSLSRYGVVISDAAKAAFLLADEQGKVRIITEELDKNFKGIAEGSANTLAGQVKLLSANWGDVKENVGEAIRIFGAPLVNSLNEAMVGTDEFGESVNRLAIWANNGAYLLQKLGLNSQLFVAKVRKADALLRTIFDKDKSKMQERVNEIRELELEQEELINSFYETEQALLRGETMAGGFGGAIKNGMDEAAEATEKTGNSIDDLAKKYENYTEKIKNNNKTFLKAQLDRNKSFKERLADMTSEAEARRLEASKELTELRGIKRARKLTVDEQEREIELKKQARASAKEVKLGVGAFAAGGGIGMLPSELTTLSGRTEMERFIGAFRAEQGQAITEFGAEQAGLEAERQGTIINFDFKGANIVDKDAFIAQVMEAVNRQGQLAELGASN